MSHDSEGATENEDACVICAGPVKLLCLGDAKVDLNETRWRKNEWN